MRNLLLEEAEYLVEETPRGIWKRFVWPNGRSYAEFTTHARWMGMPLLHYTSGLCPETGRRKTARGFIAVGRKAVGVIAIGHAAVGIVAIGQLAIGLVFGLGQAACGLAALGQAAIAAGIGVGQLATGYIAIGQLAVGYHVLAQLGMGMEVLSVDRQDPAAIEFFTRILRFFVSVEKG